MATKYGISLRINVAKSDFTKFINELASLVVALDVMSLIPIKKDSHIPP